MKCLFASLFLAILAIFVGLPQVYSQPSVRVERQDDTVDTSGNSLRSLRQFVKEDPLAPGAAEAQFRIAEMTEQGGNFNRAFDEYQLLITRYPDSDYFNEALASQLRIANYYLRGEQPSFFGLSFGPTKERVQDMYTTIIGNALYGDQAPVAQFNLGLAFEKAGDWRGAVDAYQRVLDNYPNSDIADDALYQIGYVYYRLGATGRSRDLSALEMARETFEDFLIQFPQSEKAKQAQENLNTLTQSEAQDVLKIAQFYDGSRDYKAAVIYYNDVIRRLPESEDARIAKTRIEELKAEYGEDALRPGPERTDTGERATIRRRLQAEVETSALSDYAGPPRREVVPDELPSSSRPRLRTNIDDIQPLPPVEPPLPTE